MLGAMDLVNPLESPELDGLLQAFDDKISDICGKISLLHIYQSQNREDCLELNNILGNVQYMLYNVSTMLDQQEESLHSQIKRCEDIFSLVDAQSKYIQANAPLLKVKTNAKTNQNKHKEEKPKSAQPNKSALTTKENLPKSTKKLPVPSTKKQISVTSCVDDSKKSKPLAKQNQNDPQMSNGSPFPQMLPLSKTEIESIPSYMLGRLTFEVLNEFVSAFNLTIFEKYKFISNTHHSSEGDYKRIQDYKLQENSDTKGVHFCTVNDIKELSPMKNVSTINKALICIRHCKRIKEIRGPQKLIRYCLIN